MVIKKKLFLITAILYISYMIFPLLADTFRIPVWLPSLATVALMVVMYPKAFGNKVIHWFLVYAAVLGLYVIIGKPLTIGIGTVADSRKLFIEFAYILPVISIFSILCYLDDFEVMRRLVKWSVIVLFASFIVSVPLMLQYNSLREAYQMQNESFFVPGLPGYSLMHAYTLFLPTLCFAVKVNHGWKKWFAIFGLAVTCIVIYDTFVTTSLLAMLGILLVTLFYKQDKNGLFIIMVPILFIIILFLYQIGFFVSLIEWVMPAFEGTAVEAKLIDLKDSILQGELTGGTLTGRQNLHIISWNSFLQNPIFGTPVVGLHSSLIDRFGGMGLVAGLPFVMILVSFIRQIVRKFETKIAKDFFWLGVMTGLLFLYEKGNWGGEAWLMYMVLMPIGILVFENDRKNIQRKRIR